MLASQEFHGLWVESGRRVLVALEEEDTSL